MEKVSVIKKINRMFNKKQKLQFVLIFLLIILGSFFELFGTTLFLPVVQLFLTPQEMLENKYLAPVCVALNINSANNLMIYLLVLLILVYAIKNLFLMFSAYLQLQIIYHNRLEIETKVMDSYMHKPYIYHVKKNSAEIMRIITGDVPQVFEMIKVFCSFASNLLTTTLLVVFLLLTDFKITIGVMTLMLLYLGIYTKLFRKRLVRYGQLNHMYGAEEMKNISQAFGAFKEIKIAGNEQYFVERFKSLRIMQMSMEKRSSFFQGAPKYVLEMVTICGVLGLVLVEVIAGADIKSLIPTLSVFAVSAIKIIPAISNVNSQLSSMMYCKASIDVVYRDWFEIFEEMENMTVEDSEENEHYKNYISIENITFKYPGEVNYVLNDVSLQIQKGESVALIGSSGAGKTTFLDVMLGVLQPQSGNIYFKDNNIVEKKKTWLRHIGYIAQNIYICDDSIRRNVAFGIKDEDINDDCVWKALEDAQLKDYIRNLPDGLNTILGEMGVRFSGGQRQRIGIARALYHNPEILFLDEATSALDSETEKAIMDSINYLKGKKTMIIIAHRISTIMDCDKIYRVQGGKLSLVDKSTLINN